MKGKGTRVLCTAAAFLAVSAMMVCALSPVLSSVSDAYEIRDGETAAYFRSEKTIPMAAVCDLYDDAARTGFAKLVMEGLLIYDGGKDLTDLSIEITKMESALSSKVSDGKKIQINAEIIEMKISFVLTATANCRVYSEMYPGFEDACRLLNDNRMVPGDRLEVSAQTKIVNTAEQIGEYVRNADGNFVCKKESVDGYCKYIGTKPYCSETAAEIKAVFGSESKTYVQESESRQKTYLEKVSDFGPTDAADVSADTVTYATNVIDIAVLTSGKFSVGQKVSDYCSDLYVPVPPIITIDTAESAGILVTGDLAPNRCAFYDSDPKTALFPSPGNDTLKDDAKMKEYLSQYGTVSTSYGDAKDLYDSVGDSYPGLTPLKIAVIIGSFVLLATAIAAVVLFVKKRL